MAQYRDRFAAGRTLARWLTRLLDPAQLSDSVVLGLPRGGVPVAVEVASVLGAQLDVIIVRKLGSPRNPELALGAIGEGDARVLNHDVIAAERASVSALADVERHERAELERRAQILRSGRPPVPLLGRTAVIVDDGMATGASAAVASTCARAQGAKSVIVAVPVASPESMRILAELSDRVVCPFVPPILGGVGAAFDDFHQLTDAEVVDLLK